MRRALSGIALSLLIAGCGRSAPPEPFFGEWSVSGAVNASGSAASPTGDNQAVGTEVTFGGRSARYGTLRCSGPIYTRRWLAPATFRDAYQAAPDSLGLQGREVEFVDVTCSDGSLDWAGTLIVRPDGTLLTVRGGVFFVLRRR
jgi:hypothetical protein